MSETRVGANPVGPCRPWGLAASLAWGFAAIAAWLAAQIVLGDLLFEWFESDGGEADAARLGSHAPFVSLVTLGAALVPLAVIVLAVRRSGCSLAEYLGLRGPDGRYLRLGLITLAILVPLVDLFSWFAGYAVTPQFVLDLYRTARDSGAVLLLVLAIVVVAPVVEEALFRGFLLPGLAASSLGASGAIALTSVAWALLHAQYQPFYLLQIIVLGGVFGWLRLRSGSTALTMLLHGLLNLAAMVQAAVIVEWTT